MTNFILNFNLFFKIVSDKILRIWIITNNIYKFVNKKMRVVIQRVSKASVKIDEQTKAEISSGLLIFLGVEDVDTSEDIDWLTGKIARLRIFPDENDIMNLSVKDVDGEVLVVSQFTLHASTKKGNRPSYIKASKPDFAIPMYEKFIKKLEEELGKSVQSGEFGAMMDVSLINSGPVTIVVDSKRKEWLELGMTIEW